MKRRNTTLLDAIAAHRSVVCCGLAALLVIFTAALFLFQGTTLLAQSDTDYADRPPRQCRRCHDDIYEEWADSLHALGYESDSFQAIWERARFDDDCLTCHSPAIEAERSFEGVGCGSCHEILDPAEREEDGLDFHGVMSTEPSAALCGTCHGQDHAVTYVEWQTSAHNGARTVDCKTCHLSHTGDIPTATTTELCGSCHLQEVPTVNPHMHVEGGCTDCHPGPVNMDNVHLHDAATEITCTDCHIVTEMEVYGRYPANTGHTMEVALAACTNCHGAMHALGGSGEAPAAPSDQGDMFAG
ncbi:MAG: cytochrome c3 family protein [Chloroflexi bacterium]|nr:cytochrome c3 family protein [Chloroflexota bacterium]